MQNIEKVFILLLRIIHTYFGSSHLDLSTLKRLHSIDSSFPSEQFAIDNYKIFSQRSKLFPWRTHVLCELEHSMQRTISRTK